MKSLRINNLKKGEKLILSENTFECLKKCIELNNLTRGAFDITYENPSRNSEEKIILCESEMSVAVMIDSIKIDLGAIGKGFAVDMAEQRLREWGIDAALVHGGFSSVKSIGAPKGFRGWPVSISNPNNNSQIISQFELMDFSISGSGIKKGVHILNPLTGKPAVDKSGTWALSKSAAVSDALSTAFIILQNEVVKDICDENEEIYGLTLTGDHKITEENIFIAGKSGMIETLV